LDVFRAKLVADLLQPDRVLTGSKAVGQRGEADPGLGGLAFGPLVPACPYLGGVGKPGAQLDKARAEVIIPNVEIEAGDSLVLFAEAECGGPSPVAGRVVAVNTLWNC
jgi:hypothetical protein